MAWDFNLTVRIYEQTGTGGIGDLRVETPALLRAADNGIPSQASGTNVLYPGWSLLVPSGTDVRGVHPGSPALGLPTYFGDLLAVPVDTNKWYRVRWVDDARTGQDDEYRIAILEPNFRIIRGRLTWWGLVGDELIYP